MTDYTSQIGALYEAIQFRAPPASDLSTYNAALNSGVSLSAVTNLIELDPYTTNFVNPVIREYQAAFNRVPDQGGLAHWVGQVASSPNALASLSVIFANSAEFNARYGASATTTANATLVGLLYGNVLGRQPDAGGLAYWSSQKLTAAQLLQAFAQSPEFIADTAASITLFENDEAANPPSEPTTGSLFNLAPAGERTISLTTGVDNPSLTANNNTINGTFGPAGSGATLTPGDTLLGGTTTGNVLNLVDLGAGGTGTLATSLIAVTISGIQTVNILSGEAVVANTASSPAGFTGLTQLNVTEANNAAPSTITAAATTNISVTDQSQPGGALSVQGGLNVTVATTEAASGSGSTTAVGGTIASPTIAPAGTVTITATAAPTSAGNFQMGAITVYGGTVDSITEAEVGSPGFTTTGGNVTVNGGAATTSVTVDQTPAATQNATTAGVADGSVTVTDANELGATKLGVITTVSLDGLNGANAINDSGLTNLTVNDAAPGTIVTITEGKFASPATTLNLSLNNDPGLPGSPPISGLTLNDFGDKYTTVNVTLGAAADALALNDTALTTLKISGPSSGTASALTFSSNAAALTTINASGDNGNLTFTDSWAGAVVTGGSGNDIVTLAAALTTTSGGSINFGAGDNSLLAGTGGSIGTGVTVDGGSSGDNTISAALINLGDAAGIKDFQILDVSGYGDSLDTSLLSTPITGVAISFASTAGTATLLNLAAAVTVTDTNANDSSSLTLTHAGSATNSLAINFAGTSTTATNETINTLTSTGDATITISSGGASTVATYLNEISQLLETDNQLTTITITGAQAFELQNVATDAPPTAPSSLTASSLTTIDGHLATGALTINAGETLNNVSYTGLTILGGTGGDTITNYATNGVITEGATAATVTHGNILTVYGSGATINDQASRSVDSISLYGVTETANLGSGGTAATSTTVNVFSATSAAPFFDTVNFGSGIATVSDYLAYNTTGNLLALNGAPHGDTLVFTNLIANPAGALGPPSASMILSSAQNLDQAAHNAQSPTANTVTWFVYNNNTYIEDSGVNPVANGTAGAEVVKITGIVDLSHATIGGGHLTFA
jgi:S-layer protein